MTHVLINDVLVQLCVCVNRCLWVWLSNFPWPLTSPVHGHSVHRVPFPVWCVLLLSGHEPGSAGGFASCTCWSCTEEEKNKTSIKTHPFETVYGTTGACVNLYQGNTESRLDSVHDNDFRILTCLILKLFNKI